MNGAAHPRPSAAQDRPAADREQPPADGERPLSDPIAESRRIIDQARERGIVLRALGGVAVYLQSPEGRPLLARPLKDLDLVTTRGQGPAMSALLAELGYEADEMFNALRGARRQAHFDPGNNRGLDLFIGEFSMCHQIALTARLDRDPYTVPLAELLLTKLQIVELRASDQGDVYTLCYQHAVVDHPSTIGIEVAVIAQACGTDWGLWRTCTQSIERCRADVGARDLSSEAVEVITARLHQLSEQIEAQPKSAAWRRRSRLGDRKRWYREPEEP